MSFWPPWLLSSRALGALQRVLLVALLAPALLVAIVAAVPAMLILPFLPRGTERTVRLLKAHTAYLRTLLTASQNTQHEPLKREQRGRSGR